MHWDRLFEDLEGQLASEWEAERAARDAESERLRISRLELRDRLRVLCTHRAAVTLDLAGGRRVGASLVALGADWVAAAVSDGAGSGARTTLVPLAALRGLAVDHGLLLSSLDRDEPIPSLRERMTLGFVLRDLARRRVAVRIATLEGDELHGTVDRAGADHLDLAVHDAGDARTASAVRGFRMVPFAAIAAVRPAVDQLL
ncbi:MAG: hypothetical protein J7484_11475 [Microbacterium sp.]|nr:hypothetical protein [Microbacterium sp.]